MFSGGPHGATRANGERGDIELQRKALQGTHERSTMILLQLPPALLETNQLGLAWDIFSSCKRVKFAPFCFWEPSAVSAAHHESRGGEWVPLTRARCQGRNRQTCPGPPLAEPLPPTVALAHTRLPQAQVEGKRSPLP